jgi:hypothetical protein
VSSATCHALRKEPVGHEAEPESLVESREPESDLSLCTNQRSVSVRRSALGRFVPWRCAESDGPLDEPSNPAVSPTEPVLVAAESIDCKPAVSTLSTATGAAGPTRGNTPLPWPLDPPYEEPLEPSTCRNGGGRGQGW